MADVSVDATVSTATARGMRSVVFTTDLIGYVFYLDSDGVFGYSKTSDGGATWGAQVNVDGAGATTVVAFDVWYDRWTPGDTGTLIHTWWFDTTNDIVRWRPLNTDGDTLGTVRAVFTAASAVAGRGAFVSGTKTRSGYLYCAYDIDAGAERGLHRSTDSGATWSATLSTTFVEATLDTCKLYPASGTGDDNDCWALYYDASALALTLKLWDSSAASATESATIGVAHTDGATDLTGQFGYDAVVRHSDGHLIVAALSGRDVAASTHQVFDITSTSTITTKTAIAASTDDHYYPQVFIDQNTNDLYVAYNGKRDGSEVLDTTTKVSYAKSTDGGTTWSAGDTAYMEGTAGVVQQVWSSQSTSQSGARFYAVWRVGTTLLGNKVNSVAFLTQTVGGTRIASTAQFPTGSEDSTPWVEHIGTAPWALDQPGQGGSQTVSGHNGWLSAVSVWLKATNSPSDSIYFELHQDTRTGPLLWTATSVLGSALSLVFSWVKFSLASPVRLEAATTYWISAYLTRGSGDISNAYSWGINVTTGSYAGGYFADAAGAPYNSGLADSGFRLHTLLDDIGTVTVVTGPGGATITSGSSVNAAHVVTPGAVTILGATRATTAAVNAGTVTTTTAVTGTTLASTAVVNAGTVATLTFVTGTTRATTAVVNPGSVTTVAFVTGPTLVAASVANVGTVTTTTFVTGTTIASGSVVRAGTTAALLGGATLTSGAVVRAGTVALTVTGATLGSTATLFAGSLSPVGATIGSTATLFPGSALLIGTLGGATVPSTATLFSGSVTTGAVTVSGVMITSGSTLTPGTVTTTTVVSGATHPSTATVFPGTVAVTVTGATLVSTATVFAGSVTTTTAVSGAYLASGVVLSAGAVTTTTAVLGATLASSAALFPGSVTPISAISGTTLTSTATLYPGTVVPGVVTVTGSTIVSGTQFFPGAVSLPGVLTVFGTMVPSTATLSVGAVTLPTLVAERVESFILFPV